jgi:hypothetical protein
LGKRKRSNEKGKEMSPIEAVNVLAEQGQKSFTFPESKGRCAGLALARQLGPDATVDACLEGLQDWNAHLAYAAVDAIEKGNGEVKREGRTLTITLPEYWGRIGTVG